MSFPVVTYDHHIGDLTWSNSHSVPAIPAGSSVGDKLFCFLFINLGKSLNSISNGWVEDPASIAANSPDIRLLTKISDGTDGPIDIVLSGPCRMAYWVGHTPPENIFETGTWGNTLYTSGVINIGDQGTVSGDTSRYAVGLKSGSGSFSFSGLPWVLFKGYSEIVESSVNTTTTQAARWEVWEQLVDQEAAAPAVSANDQSNFQYVDFFITAPAVNFAPIISGDPIDDVVERSDDPWQQDLSVGFYDQNSLDALTYSITPSLDAGVTLDVNTGLLQGDGTASTEVLKSYNVTCDDGNGDGTATDSIDITLLEPIYSLTEEPTELRRGSSAVFKCKNSITVPASGNVSINTGSAFLTISNVSSPANNITTITVSVPTGLGLQHNLTGHVWTLTVDGETIDSLTIPLLPATGRSFTNITGPVFGDTSMLDGYTPTVQSGDQVSYESTFPIDGGAFTVDATGAIIPDGAQPSSGPEPFTVRVIQSDGTVGPLYNYSYTPNSIPSGIPVINGVLNELVELTIDTSAISDADVAAAIVFNVFQWYRDGVPISGATSNTYTTVQADVDAVLKVDVGFTDDLGNNELLTSVDTIAIGNVNQNPQGNLTLVGGTGAAQYDTLTLTNDITDIDGLTAFTYTWYRDDVLIAGENETYYTLAQEDVDALVNAKVNYTDVYLTAEEKVSGYSQAVLNVLDAPTGKPVIAGAATATEGVALTTTVGLIADLDNEGAFSFTYEWLRGGIVIPGATNGTYIPVNADVARLLQIRATYTDDFAVVKTVTSEYTEAVINVNDDPTGTVVLQGAPKVGCVMFADISNIVDSDGLGPYVYQWIADDVNIVGENDAIYTLEFADVGSILKVRVDYVDQHGTAESITSNPSSEIINVNTAPVGKPTIEGTLIEGQTLTVNILGVTDSDVIDIGTYGYQWSADDVDIAGATASTYVLQAAEIGATIKVTFSFTDLNGTLEQTVSLASSVVITSNPTPITENTGNLMPASFNVSIALPYDLSQHVTNPDGAALLYTLAIASPLLNSGVTLDPNTGILTTNGITATTVTGVLFEVSFA